MELGEKIRRARLDAGLSQRQLCGEEITRNMLSLIENGAARPSTKTLTVLAQRLGKPIGYFLDENPEDPSDLTASAEALRRAEEALAAGKDIYAAQLLDQVTAPLLRREGLLLSARLTGADLGRICERLPSLDEELLLRAQAALEAGRAVRCAQLLLAAEDQASPRWNLLMGKLRMRQSAWTEAADCLQRAEAEFSEVIAMLEICFRELGDYKRAYEYACKRREQP